MKPILPLFLLFLSTCAPLAPALQTPIKTSTASTRAWPTLTHPPQTTPTVTPNGLSNCLPLLPENQIDSRGKLLLESQKGLFMLDMSSKVLETISTNETRSAASPDHPYFAYLEKLSAYQESLAPVRLVVSDINGNTKIFDEKSTWGMFLGWGANGAVIYSSFGNQAQDQSREPADLLILYPLENRAPTLLLNSFEQYPIGDDLGQIVPWWRGWSGTSYSPDFDRAVTPYQLPGSDSMRLVTYALWQMPSRTLIRSFESVYAFPLGMNYYPEPIWSPDGSQFIFFVTQRQGQSAFLVKRDGTLTPLTIEQPVFEQGFTWSPDGKMIAVFNPADSLHQEDRAYLSILNTETKIWSNFCFGVNYRGVGYARSEPYPVIWSPDSTQLVVTDWNEKNTRHLFLIDIARQTFSLLAENLEPTGWLQIDKNIAPSSTP